MRWKGRRQSDNIEDRRGSTPKGAVAGGGVVVVIIAVVVMLLGGDPGAVLNAAGDGGGGGSNRTSISSAAEEEFKEFVAVTLADTEEVWTKEFARRGGRYEKPKLVIFQDRVESACGLADSGVGPFYCGGDRTIYIDLSFFEELKRDFGARGDFAPAYVIAHEVGHHVQELLGTMEKVDNAKERANETKANQLSVRLELQADYYAGVWAHHAKDMAGLDEGDIREAMEAASAIGDDNIQKQAQGFVEPESFTHGTGDQRVKWFIKGFRSGRVEDGDTFSPRNP